TVARRISAPIFASESVRTRRGTWVPHDDLLALPTDPIARVLEGHAEGRKRVPDPVGRREVLSLPSVFAERDEEVEETVHQGRTLRAVFEEAEDPGDRLEHPRGLLKGGPSRPDLDRLVHDPRIIE